MDAITMLKEDHQTVEQLFRRFETAGARAHVEKRRIVDRIIEELVKHAAIEEQLFYPVARATVSQTEDTVLESLEEHHIVTWVLSELDGMDATDERFDAKVTVLIENVRHHVSEEENELFPMVRADLDRKALTDLGDAMKLAKADAPTHPHPRSPDTPAGKLAFGMSAGVCDRINDTISGLTQGSVIALRDLIAVMVGRQPRSPAPTGSMAARRTAGKVRATAASITEDAIAAAQRTKATAAAVKAGAQTTAQVARRGTEATVEAARSGAKGTATSARKASKRTSTTAKRAATTTRRTAAAGVTKTAATARRAAKSAKETAVAS